MTHPLAKLLREHAWENREDLDLARRAADELDRLHRPPPRVRPSFSIRQRELPDGAQMALDREVGEALAEMDDWGDPGEN
jgi:hypothetical protein